MAPSRKTRKISPIERLVARNIRAARGEMSQAELGRQAGIDPQQISKYERCVHTPNGENLSALAEVLGRDLTWFYMDHEAGIAA